MPSSEWYKLNPTRRLVLGWCAGWIASVAGLVAVFRWSEAKRWHVKPQRLPVAVKVAHHIREPKGPQRKRLHATASHSSASMLVSKMGVVHWPNVFLFKTRYSFDVVDSFSPEDWKAKMGQGAFGRRIPEDLKEKMRGHDFGRYFRKMRRWEAIRQAPAAAGEAGNSVKSRAHYFMGYREEPIRETLALASLSIDKSQGWVNFGNLEEAIAILEPGLTYGRRGERNRMLYARLVALACETQPQDAENKITTTLRALQAHAEQDEFKGASRHNRNFAKWHSKTVDRRTGVNTFRAKLERRVDYAKRAMHATLCEMGACSSNGQDTRSRDRGSTPLQAPKQYRHRRYLGRLRRRWRRWLTRKLSPKPSRAARREKMEGLNR